MSQSICLNPDCLGVNAADHNFCQKCRTPLVLKMRYRALKILGQGGFGRTFLAIDEDRPSKPVCVIKQFLPQAQGAATLAKAAEMFDEEAMRLDELGEKYDQIPSLLAHFTVDDRQYLVQEFIDGENLHQELKSGVFTQDQVKKILLDLLNVLQFVHGCHVINRDIKPENIIRRRSDQKLVLVDFGASKVVANTRLSVVGTVIGSAEYAAPEQVQGKPKYASDLYSLGVTCLELLTGISPFDLYDIDEGDWIWRDFLNNNPVDQQLGKVLDKLVKPATKRRYQSADEVLADLQGQQPPVLITPVASGVIHVATPANISRSFQSFVEDLDNGIQLEMIAIPVGRFRDEEGNIVEINQPYYMGKYQVTEEQWNGIRWQYPPRFNTGNNYPAQGVSWLECQEFLKKLNKKTKKIYRLPSESEWEYACRAVTSEKSPVTKYCFGNDENQLKDYAWNKDNSGDSAHSVGEKKPNQFGLYDMHGNVWEWCEDTWKDSYFEPRTQEAYKNIDHTIAVLRGGSWSLDPYYCRSAYRGKSNLDNSVNYGFRLVLSASVSNSLSL